MGFGAPKRREKLKFDDFSGIKKSFSTVKDFKIEIFHFLLKDSKSTKNFQNFDTKFDIVRQKMKLLEPSQRHEKLRFGDF